MKKIMMIATAMIMVAGGANALTIKSGQVLTTNADGTQSVVNIEDSANTQKQLEQNGYAVGAGKVIIAAGETTVVIDQDDLVGKSKQEVVDLITDEIIASGYASGSIKVDGIADEAAHNAANEAAQATYQEAVEAALEVEHNATKAAIAAEQAAADAQNVIEQAAADAATAVNDAAVQAAKEKAEADCGCKLD